MPSSHADDPGQERGLVAVVVPETSPDPEAERRFAEAPFPLLEPVGWSGERRRGGYGVHRPGGETISLGLVFGPAPQGGSVPRLAVSVGGSFVAPFSRSDPASAAVAVIRLGRRTDPRQDLPAIKTVLVDVAGKPVEFELVRWHGSWLAQGTWQGYAVELIGDQLEPEGIALQPATSVPTG